MKVKVSTKYQIVIPKNVRRQLGIKPGHMVTISEVKGKHVTLTKGYDADEYIEHYAGTLHNTPWQKAGVDAAEWLRQERDTDQ